jgi:hypothetical protein
MESPKNKNGKTPPHERRNLRGLPFKNLKKEIHFLFLFLKRRIYISSGLGLYSSSQKIIQSLKKKERKKRSFFFKRMMLSFV